MEEGVLLVQAAKRIELGITPGQEQGGVGSTGKRVSAYAKEELSEGQSWEKTQCTASVDRGSRGTGQSAPGVYRAAHQAPGPASCLPLNCFPEARTPPHIRGSESRPVSGVRMPDTEDAWSRVKMPGRN